MEPIDLLAIAAHPDDVELSCAGTMISAKKSGKRTAIVDLTRGELSTRGTLESRARETDEATRILQLDERFNLGMPDGNIELSQENLRLLIEAIRTLRPQIMLTPHRHERHPDHEAACELAHRAAFYAGLAKIETMDELGNPQQPHRPLLVMHYMQTFVFEPSVIVDVTDVFPERMAAMMAYASQFARSKFSSARVGTKHENALDILQASERETFLSQKGFNEWIEARARSYGMIIGAEFGEPFWAEQTPGTRDIFSLVTKHVA